MFSVVLDMYSTPLESVERCSIFYFAHRVPLRIRGLTPQNMTPAKTTLAASQDHFRAKIRIVLSKLCRKFGFEEIKALMPEEDKKLVAHMQTTAERELKAKKAHLAGGHEGGGDGAKRGGGGKGGGDGGIKKALRTFDTMMEGKCAFFAFVYVADIGIPWPDVWHACSFFQQTCTSPPLEIGHGNNLSLS